MKLIDDIKLNKTLKVIELYVCENQKKQPVLTVKAQGSDKIMHLKRFFGRAQYRKWLLEAALLHLLVGDSYKKDIARVYKSVLKTLIDDKNNEIL